MLAAELSALARVRGARYVLVEGPRVRERASWLPAQAADLTDAQALCQLVPDLAERDVYVCGSPGWMDAVLAAARGGGVPAEQLHAERFSY